MTADTVNINAYSGFRQPHSDILDTAGAKSRDYLFATLAKALADSFNESRDFLVNRRFYS